MPTPLVEKSNKNIESARLLMEEELWNSSVHCSYYACLQIIKQIVYNLKTKRIADQQLSRGDTHRYLIQCMVSDLAGKAYRDGGMLQIDFQSKISELKGRRESADYSETIINEVDSDAAQNLAVDLIDYLNQIYKVKDEPN